MPTAASGSKHWGKRMKIKIGEREAEVPDDWWLTFERAVAENVALRVENERLSEIIQLRAPVIGYNDGD